MRRIVLVVVAAKLSRRSWKRALMLRKKLLKIFSGPHPTTDIHRQNHAVVLICGRFVHTGHGPPRFFLFRIFEARMQVFDQIHLFRVLIFLRKSAAKAALFNAVVYSHQISRGAGGSPDAASKEEN